MKYAKGTAGGYLIGIKLKWPQNLFLKTAHGGVKYLVQSSQLFLCGLSETFAKCKHFKKNSSPMGFSLTNASNRHIIKTIKIWIIGIIEK